MVFAVESLKKWVLTSICEAYGLISIA